MGSIALLACGCDRPSPEDAQLGARDVAEVLKLSPLPEAPPSPTNAVADNDDAAHLGQLLFYDSRLSSNGAVSCATCHDPQHGFSDGKPLSEGLATTRRHSQALWNVAHQRWFFWDGRADSLWAQSLQPLQDESEMGATPAHIHDVVAGDAELAAAYEAVFGPVPAAGEALERFLGNLGKCFEAYQRKIVSTGSRFDAFVARVRGGEPPESAGLSEEELRGLKIFVGRGQCVLCHSGPNLTDSEFHNIGLPKHPDLKKDSGRFEGVRLVKKDPFNGTGAFSDDRSEETNIKLRYLVVKMNNMAEFKTPSLRNVALTAPYMHDGRFATIGEVLTHYSELKDDPPLGHREETLVPLKLSKREKAELEAFLRTLTGEPLDESLLGPPPKR
ncbi:MAG: methylamine utilization protein [Akkermansiaceae bacterium]|nr:methylamine utilization protein [Akkermansiaceae bacterium]NNM31411.1 methylamine utilization protein [Akkermansiaceae bacterium]